MVAMGKRDEYLQLPDRTCEGYTRAKLYDQAEAHHECLSTEPVTFPQKKTHSETLEVQTVTDQNGSVKESPQIKTN